MDKRKLKKPKDYSIIFLMIYFVVMVTFYIVLQARGSILYNMMGGVYVFTAPIGFVIFKAIYKFKLQNFEKEVERIQEDYKRRMGEKNAHKVTYHMYPTAPAPKPSHYGAKVEIKTVTVPDTTVNNSKQTRNNTDSRFNEEYPDDWFEGEFVSVEQRDPTKLWFAEYEETEEERMIREQEEEEERLKEEEEYEEQLRDEEEERLWKEQEKLIEMWNQQIEEEEERIRRQEQEDLERIYKNVH